MATKTLYKIRNKDTGLFSKCGYLAKIYISSWDKNGEAWQGLGPLKNHLALYRDEAGNYHIPENWEVVIIEITETETSSVSAREFLGVS